MAAWREECIVTANYAVKVPDGLDLRRRQQHHLRGRHLQSVRSPTSVGQWIMSASAGWVTSREVSRNVFNAKVIAIDVNDGQLELAASMNRLTINSRERCGEIPGKNRRRLAAVVTAVAKTTFNSAVVVRAGDAWLRWACRRRR